MILVDERDELANEREMGLTEADYEEMAAVFAAMDALETALEDGYEEYLAYFNLLYPELVPMSFEDWLLAA